MGPFSPNLGGFTNSPSAGGGGGRSFNIDCGSNRALTGVRAEQRNGAQLDRIGARCRDYVTGVVSNVGYVGANLGSGGIVNVDCPLNGVVTGFQGRSGLLIDRIQMICRK